MVVQAVTPTPQRMMVSTSADSVGCQNGTAIINGASETDVFAGQQMLLCVAPPPPPLTVVSGYWSFDNIADISGGFTNSAGNGKPSAANDGTGGGQEAADPDLTRQNLTYYFVNPGTRETASCHWTLSNSDPNGNSSSADFFIDGPTSISAVAQEQQTQLHRDSTKYSDIPNGQSPRRSHRHQFQCRKRSAHCSCGSKCRFHMGSDAYRCIRLSRAEAKGTLRVCPIFRRGSRQYLSILLENCSFYFGFSWKCNSRRPSNEGCIDGTSDNEDSVR